jgi:hypothetical protein
MSHGTDWLSVLTVISLIFDWNLCSIRLKNEGDPFSAVIVVSDAVKQSKYRDISDKWSKLDGTPVSLPDNYDKRNSLWPKAPILQFRYDKYIEENINRRFDRKVVCSYCNTAVDLTKLEKHKGTKLCTNTASSVSVLKAQFVTPSKSEIGKI